MTKNKHKTAEFWDAHAHPFYSYERRTKYCDEFLKRAAIKPGETVLDMGCGSGTLCIPLSDEGHKVFCADFSQGMLNTVEDVIKAEGITNLTTKLLSWEDDWQAAKVPVCDVAISSRSLLAENIEDAVAKLDAHARRRVCITARAAGDLCWTSKIADFLGREAPETFDYARIIKAGLDLGRMVDVGHIIDKRIDIFETQEGLRQFLKRKVPNMNAAEEERFNYYCETHFKQYSDEQGKNGWICDDGAFSAWTFISWNKFVDDADIDKTITWHSSCEKS